MTKIPEYVRGYRDAFKDVITFVYRRADEMHDPHARMILCCLADTLGYTSKELEHREMFQRLRAYVKENAELPPHLPEQWVEKYGHIEQTIEHNRALRQKLKEGLELRMISQKDAVLTYKEKKDGDSNDK